MSEKLDHLLTEMHRLEKEMNRELKKHEFEYEYEVRKRKVHFSVSAKIRHKPLVKRISRYLLDSQFRTVLTTPVIWGCLIPVLLLDLVGSIYQAICFPVYGIPKARRCDYIALDRHRLRYLNFIERLNCNYCGYANGVLAYMSEIAGRTEQYWCPIKHALRVKAVHSRYKNFFDFGNAEDYRLHIEKVRRAFDDLQAASV